MQQSHLVLKQSGKHRGWAAITRSLSFDTSIRSVAIIITTIPENWYALRSEPTTLYVLNTSRQHFGSFRTTFIYPVPTYYLNPTWHNSKVEYLKTHRHKYVCISDERNNSCIDELCGFSQGDLGDKTQQTDEKQEKVVFGVRILYYPASVLPWRYCGISFRNYKKSATLRAVSSYNRRLKWKPPVRLDALLRLTCHSEREEGNESEDSSAAESKQSVPENHR